MSTNLSVAEVLSNLEAQMDLHRRQEAHHAEQEAFHREQRAFHSAELENVTRHYESFRGVAGSAAEVAARRAAGAPAPAAAPPPPKEEEMPPPDTPALRSRLVTRVVLEQPAGQSFTPSSLAAAINRRFAKVLKRPLDRQLVSAALRRMAARGEVRLVQRGTAHHQALYAR